MVNSKCVPNVCHTVYPDRIQSNEPLPENQIPQNLSSIGELETNNIIEYSQLNFESEGKTLSCCTAIS